MNGEIMIDQAHTFPSEDNFAKVETGFLSKPLPEHFNNDVVDTFKKLHRMKQIYIDVWRA